MYFATVNSGCCPSQTFRGICSAGAVAQKPFLYYIKIIYAAERLSAVRATVLEQTHGHFVLQAWDFLIRKIRMDDTDGSVAPRAEPASAAIPASFP